MDIVTIPCLNDNYAYLIIDTGCREAAVVDPSEAWPILRMVEDRNVQLTTVLCTHHHGDHIGGVDDLIEHFPDLTIVGYHEDHARIPQLTMRLRDGDRFTIGDLAGNIFHTPGHTKTHVVYRLADNLFVGDTLFGAGCGRLFEGTAEQMVRSLDLVVGFGKQCNLYFGHEYTAVNLRFASQVEPENEMIEERAARIAALAEQEKPSTPSTVAEELQTNPFLRLSEDGVVRYLRNHHNLKDTGPVAVFAALRELRNHFG